MSEVIDMKKNEKVPLQALKMRGGWQMIKNQFFDMDITEYENDDNLDFTQDIMYMKTHTPIKEIKFGLLLVWDLDYDLKRQFCLKVIKEDDFMNPIEEFCSRDKNKIVDKIETYLQKLLYSYKHYNRIYEKKVSI